MSHNPFVPDPEELPPEDRSLAWELEEQVREDTDAREDDDEPSAFVNEFGRIEIL